ncbi:fimbrial protein [Enterobacter sp. 22452]|uniref:fimbrial protein n=1 Tax=Enterobacter TaxID=547 RepID=UPI003F8465C3
MIINKTLITVALFATASAYAAEPTTVNFDATGKITENSCQLELAQSVTINPISFESMHDSSYVKNNGPDSNGTFVMIDAKYCTPGTVTASILGAADENDSDLLAIDQGEGAAKNVGIAFFSGPTLLAPNTSSAAPTGGIDGDHFFQFMIDPVSVIHTTPQPGKIHTTAQVHINYL